MAEYGTFTSSKEEIPKVQGDIKKKIQITCVVSLLLIAIATAAYVFLNGPLPITKIGALNSINTTYKTHFHRECVQKKTHHSSIVCVCNATYCDETPPIRQLEMNEFMILTSSQDGLRFHEQIKTFQTNVINDTYEGTVLFNIPRDRTNQKIIGFGGSFSDSASINIRSLSPSAQENLLRSYFGKEGIGYSMSRIPIGASDFSTHHYTYDDTPYDVYLDEFSLHDEDLKLKIPLIKEASALAGKALKLVGSAWSAPNWMKTIDKVDDGALKKEYYQTWADYHIRFLNEYEKNGIEFWALTTGNEPQTGIIYSHGMGRMRWSATDQSNWIANNLGPTLDHSKHKNVLIITLDDTREYMSEWADRVLNTGEAEKYVQGFGIHWYSDWKISGEVLTKTHAAHPNKFLLMTESCSGYKSSEESVSIGSWTRAEAYITDIIDNINHHLAGWIDWNLALNEEGGPNWTNNYVDSAIIVNKTSDEFYKQPIFYAMGHVSKFIPSGSFHITVEPQSDSGIEVMAAERTDNGITIVFYNKNDEEKKISFVDILRGIITVQVPKKSINTIIYK